MNKELIKQLIWNVFWEYDGTKKDVDDVIDDIYDKVFEPLLKQIEYWEEETRIARRDCAVAESLIPDRRTK